MPDPVALLPNITPPVFRVTLADRTPLLDVLSANADRRLTLVDAPAGYGKTCLLATRYAQLHGSGARVVWLSAEGADTAQFLILFVNALARAGLDVGTLETGAEHGFSDVPAASVVRSLASVLAGSATPVTLIIDDLHRLDRRTVQEILLRLIGEAPASTRFVCAGWDCSMLPRASLRARGELCEIGVDDLRFSLTEARTLLPRLQPGQLQRLLERTEGWPVALQLARLWLEARPERSALLDAFSGRTSEVAEYLTERVLHDLSAPLQAALFEIAVLDVLNPELVAAVTGRPQAWSELLEGGHLEHFLVPLDEERYWFRLHHLLSDYLRAKRRERGIDASVLHGRAVTWFERHGRMREAVKHAVLADDVPRAVGLIERIGGWEVVLFGGISLLRSLLASLPADRLAEFPRIQLVRAYLAIKEGDVVGGSHLYEQIVNSHQRGKDPQLDRDMLMVGAISVGYQGGPVLAGTLDRMLREFDALQPADSVGRATLLNATSLVALGISAMNVAHDVSARSVREMRRIGSVLGVNYCLLHFGLSQLYVGERGEAEATFREATVLAEESFGADSGLKALADCYLSLALHARGDLAASSERFAPALQQIETGDGWPDIFAEVYEIAAANALARGDAQAAHALIDRMQATATRRGIPNLGEIAQALRMRTALLSWPRDSSLREALERDEPLQWRAGAWRDEPTIWRQHHAAGVTLVLGALLDGKAGAAVPILDDLETAAASGYRRRHLHMLAALRAAVRLQAGEGDAAIETFMPHLEACVREDDTQFLLDFGPPLLPMLQQAWQWSRQHGGSSRVRHVLSSAVAAVARTMTTRDAPAALSERELEVLVELAKGAPNKVIARQLQMTENTVKFHLKKVFQKLQIQNRAEALQAARARGLLT
jgi:LuxR family maltose regulon positive regulatory protein